MPWESLLKHTLFTKMSREIYNRLGALRMVKTQECLTLDNIFERVIVQIKLRTLRKLKKLNPSPKLDVPLPAIEND